MSSFGAAKKVALKRDRISFPKIISARNKVYCKNIKYISVLVPRTYSKMLHRFSVLWTVEHYLLLATEGRNMKPSYLDEFEFYAFTSV